MKKKSKKTLYPLIILIVLMVFTVAFNGLLPPAQTGFGFRRDSYGLHSVYKQASAIIVAKCLDNFTAPSGADCSTYSIKKVIAGEQLVKKGSFIKVNGTGEIGKTSLLYLATVSTSPVSGETVFSIVRGGEFDVKGDLIVLSDGREITFDELSADISKMAGEIMLPSKYFYYDSRGSVVRASDAIFIGRVDEIEILSHAPVFTLDRGEESRKREDVRILTVTVTDGLGNGDSNDNTFKIYITNTDEKLIYNARTSEFLAEGEAAALPAVGKTYLFFLKRSPDGKDTGYFLVNSYQGIMETDGTSVIPHEMNAPFKDMLYLQAIENEILRIVKNSPSGS